MGRTGEDAIQISTAQPCPHPGKPTAPPGGGRLPVFVHGTGRRCLQATGRCPGFVNAENHHGMPPTGLDRSSCPPWRPHPTPPACRPAGRGAPDVSCFLLRGGEIGGGGAGIFLDKGYYVLYSIMRRGGHLMIDPQPKRGLLIPVCWRTVPGESHGYKIVKDLSACIDISESTLYPILRRLETDGCLTAQCGAQWPPAQALHHHRAGARRLDSFLASQEEVMGIYHFVRRQRDDKA